MGGETQRVHKKMQTKAQETEKRHVKAEMHAAKLGLVAARLSSFATSKTNEYNRAVSKAEEYTKASKAFTSAGNPMAAAMTRKAKRWRTKAAKLKLSSRKVNT